MKNISPHISGITSHKSRLIGPQSDAGELLRQKLGESGLLGIQQIYSEDRLTIQRQWIQSLWPTENVLATPLNTTLTLIRIDPLYHVVSQCTQSVRLGRRLGGKTHGNQLLSSPLLD